MPNLRHAWNNLYRDAELVASSEAAALPAEASQNTDPSYPFRSGTVAVAVTLDADLGAAQAISAIFARNVRLFTGGALKVYEGGSAGSPGSWTLVATLPAADLVTRVTYAFITLTTARHWRFEWTNPDLVSGYVELGYAHLGSYYEQVQNVALPIDWRLVDPSEQTRSVDGQKTSTVRTMHLAGAFVISPAQATDRDTLVNTIYRAVGQHTPYFIVLNTSLSWSAMLLRFTSAIEARFDPGVGLWTVSWEWEEER